MIKSIVLENFQSHVKTVIEPAPAGKLTVIVGPSDSGKTSIIRALRWLFYNVPQGMDFINIKAGAARVIVEYADDRRVIRERHRRNYNRYEVDEQKFEGFGSGVPLEVQEVTGVQLITIGDQEFNLNLAEQLDGPFLGKAVSTGARAKVLGKLAGTEEIDYAQKQLNTDIYRRRQEEKNLNTEIAGLQDELKKYDYLPELKRTITQVSVLLVTAKKDQQKKDRLEKLRENLQKAGRQIKNCAALIDSLEMFILAAETPAGRVEISMLQRDRLTAEKQKLDEIATGITAAQNVLVKTTGTIEADQNIYDVQLNVGTLNNLKESQVKLGAAVKGIQSAEAVLGKTKAILDAEWLYSLATIAVERISRLWVAAANLENVNLQIEHCVDIIDRLRPAAEAVPVAALVNNKMRQLFSLHPLAANLKNVNSDFLLCVKKIDWLTFIPTAENVLKNLEGRYGKLDFLIAKQDGLQRLSRDAADMATAANECAATVQTLQDEYQDLLVSFGVCPMCGAEINQFKLKEVV